MGVIMDSDIAIEMMDSLREIAKQLRLQNERLERIEIAIKKNGGQL